MTDSPSRRVLHVHVVAQDTPSSDYLYKEFIATPTNMYGDLALQLVTASHRATLSTAPQLPLPKNALPRILAICLETRQLQASSPRHTSNTAPTTSARHRH